MHIVETRMFCTVCLKSSCLLICFHSWSLDLSQSHIQTIQIPKEEKTGPKPWKNKDKKRKTFHPMSPVHLLLTSFPWVDFFLGRFLPLCQSINVSCSFFVVFWFPVSWVPGRIFHPDKHPLAQLSLLHILYWCLH